MKMADKIADAQTVEPESSSSDRLAHVIQDDHDLGQSIISGARGYGVTIQPGHSAVLAIAQHRRKHSKASEDARIEFQEALQIRSEEHTSELQSLMRISYAVFCLKKKNKKNTHNI